MTKFVITESRKNFLLHNFVGYSFEQNEHRHDLEADKTLFDSITSPEDIFFLAQHCNWDDGATIPEWIIDSPICTKAAALTLFWQSAPYEFMVYSFGSNIPQWRGVEEDEEQTKILNMLNKLITKYRVNEFHQLNIRFDFDVWGGKLIVDSPKWQPPKDFFKSIEGVDVI